MPAKRERIIITLKKPIRFSQFEGEIEIQQRLRNGYEIERVDKFQYEKNRECLVYILVSIYESQ